MGPPSPGETRQGLEGLGWQGLAAAMAVALYLPSLWYGWVYDDQMEVVRNAFVRSFAHLPRMFTTTVWAGSGEETYLYRPLALVTYAVNYAVSGLAPWSYHLLNVLLHAGVSALVVRVGLLWRLPVVAAGLAGVLFAVHPVHVEPVAAVFGRKDLLAALFVLATLLSHRRGLVRGGVRAVLPVVWYVVAMLSKEIGVVALPLLVLQDLRLEEDRRAFFDRRRVMGMYFGYMGALVAYLLVRVWVTGTFQVADTSWLDNPLVAASMPVRWVTAAWVMVKGVGLLFVPLDLSPDYSFNAIPPVTSLGDPRVPVVAAVVALLVGGLVHRRSRAGVAWAGAAYLVALFPVSNLAALTGTIFGERLLYIPSVAFCLAMGWAAARLLRRGTGTARTTTGVAAAAVLVTLGAQTARYAGAWSDDISLFTRAAAAQPNSTKAHHKLGEELVRAGRIAEALGPLDRALAIAPGNLYARETLVTALRMAAADTVAGANLLRGFIDSAGSRHPTEAALAAELLRRLEGGP